MLPTTAARRNIQLFATCLVETIRPRVGIAVVKVMERLGVDVDFPEAQTCCGQPAFNAGGLDDARAMARHTVDVLSASSAPVVVPSGSCADMLVHHYPELLRADPVYGPKARALSARTYEFAQYLNGLLGGSELGACGAGKLTYHPSCHLLRGMGVSEAPQRLLRSVSGVDVVPLPDQEQCCGFGGLFSVKMSDISGAMLERKLECVLATGADAVVGCDVSCLMHIEGGLHRRGAAVTTRHLAEVLAQE